MNKIFLGVLTLSMITLTGCGGPGTPEIASAEVMELATCLNDNGRKMYGTDTCKFCKMQKESFASAFENITYIDCNADSAACDAAGIEGYPTWVSPSNEKFPGLQELSNLGTYSGCTPEVAAPSDGA